MPVSVASPYVWSKRIERIGLVHEHSTDVIFVIDDGRIVESGRHATLLARGLYSRLYRAQFRDLSA